MRIVRASMILVLLLSAFAGPGRLYAQESGVTPSPITPATPSDTGIAQSDSQAKTGELLLRTESGELIPVRGILPDSVLDGLLLSVMEQRSVPRYTVAQQELSGSIDRDEVTLKLQLEIQVHPAEEWVTVPMMFGDVYVKHFDHQSRGANDRAVPQFFGEQNSRQLHLFGAGVHTVTVELMGKARSSAPGVRQLSLNLLSATVSHAEVAFASPVELQPLPPGSVYTPTRDDKGVRSVKFYGLSQSFNLAWTDVVQQVAQKPVIQVQSSMTLDLTTIPVNLTGLQKLQVSGSPVSELNITFPGGFQLQEVDVRNSSGISILNNFEITSSAGTANGTGPITALVRLTAATEAALTLSFDLELVNRTFPQDIRVSLPAVKDANVQSGDLDILFPTGLLVEQTVVEGAQRKRVASDTDNSIAATAFRMRSTDSHVVLHVEETEAQFAVSPELTLQPVAQNVMLTARYPISVLTGDLLDLAVYWPGYSSGEWQILPGTTRLISGKTSVPLSLPQSETEKDVLRMTFRERQSGEFTVEFQAYAPLAAVRSGEIQLRCPEIQTRLGQPFVLTTIESDEYSIRPISMGTGELLPTVPMPTPTSTVAVGSGLKSESWLHDDASVPIRLELPAQAPSVRASIQLGMQPRGADIEVLETISLEVEHRDLTNLSLKVPFGIFPTVRLAGKSEVLRASIDSETHWSFRLPEARRGSLTFEVHYKWTPEVTTDPMPLILPESAEVLSIEAGTGFNTGITVQGASDWRPVYSEVFDAAWHSSTPVTSVPLRWQTSPALTTGDSPDLILARTQIVGTQRLTTTIAIFEKLPEMISMETPLDVGSPVILCDIRCDQQSLTSPEAQQQGDVRWEKIVERGVIRWTVRLSAAAQKSENDSGPHLIECRTRTQVPPQSSLWQIATLKRVVFTGESPAIPVVWCTTTQDDLRTAGASTDFISLTHSGTELLPWGENTRAFSDRQLKSLLSPYPVELQLMTMDRLDHWISLSDRHDLFFGSAESGVLRLNLVPFVSLLLVSAMICVGFFLMMSVLQRISAVIPLLFIGCTSLVSWLILPEWTALLAPYVAMGILFGTVSVIFQRMVSDRRNRFPQASQVGEYPTIFGFSGMLSHSGNERSEPIVVPAGSKSEFNVSSFV
ncbi:MAG: hypothetical protein KDB01_08765 [Planctomycetaceae bacterium]|nr:hypothetical protein [Planctomycetaceae bacterium]